MSKLPLWARALRRTDRIAWWAYRLDEVVRDEIFRAWLDPSFRDGVIEDAYRKQKGYLPGGVTYERGLFGWETKILESEHFPKAGRLLLGAAGGGRELHALAARGFDVVAFEPNAALRGEGVLAGTYADLVRAARSGSGPLARLRDEGPFAATILGWGSFTHLLAPDDQRALLTAIRELSPTGPVLLSFFMRAKSGARGKADRVRDVLRATFTRLGGRRPPSGLAYDITGGFVWFFEEEEIHTLAFEAGYEVVVLEREPFGHAVLRPLTTV